MPSKKKGHDPSRVQTVMSEGRRFQEERASSYREQALALFPPVCAHCGREFDGKALRTLTVHHKDHNHDNNPPNGSNWELLCIYCHDDVHSRSLHANDYAGVAPERDGKPTTTFKPFADLEARLKGKDKTGRR